MSARIYEILGRLSVDGIVLLIFLAITTGVVLLLKFLLTIIGVL